MTIYTPKTHTEILNLLLSKSINEHYTRRYIKFIAWCSSKEKIESTEIHHILPKANSCFPEYANLKTFKWNSIKLTKREHFIAHWLLWKALGKFMAYAFKAMNRKSKYQTDRYFKMNSRTYERLREEVALQQSVREITDETRKNMSNSQLKRNKITCPHCDKTGDPLNMIKYCFDNCKTKTGLLKHNTKQLTNIVICPHCGKSGKEQGMLATHFDQCKVIRGDFRKITKEVICPNCNKIGKDCNIFKRQHFENCYELTKVKLTFGTYDLTPSKCPHCESTGSKHGLLSKHFDNCKVLKPVLPKIKCIHCQKEGNDNGYFKSHHFDKCKFKS